MFFYWIKKVKVNIQLYRPGNEAISEPVDFRYKPSYNINSNRKRPRPSSSFYDSDIPVVVNENSHFHNRPASFMSQNDNAIDEDIEQMFPDLFEMNDGELNQEGNWNVFCIFHICFEKKAHIFQLNRLKLIVAKLEREQRF